jgi:dipeptidyl aminopeptidase/acylaminoacyl peptidase
VYALSPAADAWVLDPPFAGGDDATVLSTEPAHEATKVEFDADGTTLRGWLYRPRGRAATAPAVIMAHGYNCIKELYLDRYAAAFANAGHVVLAYDHRNFGDSDGEPRQELDPWMQVRDYRNAITFVQTLDGVDPERIGIWGTSYAGGHVLVVAAIDRRVRCVVAQVPTISGWQTTLRRIAPQALPGQRAAWDADRLERYKGNPPKMVPMVVDPAAGGAASHGSADAWEFFTGKNAPEKDKWRFKKWRNETTLRSLEMYSEYEPGVFIERIAPTPLLMVLGDADVICPTDLGLAAFNRAGEPKRLELYPGGHFSAYTDQLDRAAKAATEWFTQHLRP